VSDLDPTVENVRKRLSIGDGGARRPTAAGLSGELDLRLWGTGRGAENTYARRVRRRRSQGR
jgi:hypothetical protein